MDLGDPRESSLYNKDLAPVPMDRRTWGIYNYASLWVAMSVCIPTYMLASGLIAGGMSWKQAIGTILLGNVIVLIPMILNAHAGAKYGIPFPVLVRASFGTRGANVPAVLRALVACGWFGIQSWIGGQAIYSMLQVLWPAAASSVWTPWICFYSFWLLTMAVIWRGIDTIKYLEGIGAPFMLAVGLLLLWWIARKAGGLGPVLDNPSKFQTTGEFMRFFIPSLTGMVGFWATVALNIPDFTRYAKSQKAQMIGQALGLPASMTIYSFIGVAVTSASVILFGQAIWDPVVLLARFHEPVIASIALVALLVATFKHQRRSQRGLAIQRFFKPESTLDFFSNRRPDHGRSGRTHDALETADRFPKLHFRLAGRILCPAGSCGRNHDHRLFPAAAHLSRRRRAVQSDGDLSLRKRRQLSRHRRIVRGRSRGAHRTVGSSAALALRLRLVCRIPGVVRDLLDRDAQRTAPNARLVCIRLFRLAWIARAAVSRRTAIKRPAIAQSDAPRVHQI